MAALKGAIELVQAGRGVIDQAAMSNALYEIQQRLLETQSAALRISEENSVLVERVRDLESAAKKLADWEVEAAKYERTNVAHGVYAYTEKGREGALIDAIKMCANCFGDQSISILQAQHAEMRQRALMCLKCKSRLVFRSYSDQT